MSIKVFVLGRPGSGKSTAARYLNQLARRQDRHVAHCNDYDILLEMFLTDTEHKKFRPTAHNGFDATDFTVLDDALQELEHRVRQILPSVDLVTIEFARDDYQQALQQFNHAFLRDARFLFLDAHIDTCLRRVQERVERAECADDHPSFSEEIFRRYYGRNNKPYMSGPCRAEFQIEQEVEIIDNSGSLNDFLVRLERFAARIFARENNLLASAPGSTREAIHS